MSVQRMLHGWFGVFSIVGITLLCPIDLAAAPPPGIQGNVTVQNDESNPVPVEGQVTVLNDESNPITVIIQSDGQEKPQEVIHTLPVLYRVQEFLGHDESKAVAITQRVILYDLTIATLSIWNTAGCNVRVQLTEGGIPKVLFSVVHYDKDGNAFRDGQITQQRLGRGVVIESGENIVLDISAVHSAGIAVGPNAVCQGQVSIYGEVVPS